MNLIDFSDKFPDEESCKQKFKEFREREGIVCRKCGYDQLYWKKDKEMYECKKCHSRVVRLCIDPNYRIGTGSLRFAY